MSTTHIPTALGRSALVALGLTLTLGGSPALAGGLAPAVDDQPASALSVTRTGAFLTGAVNPEESATTYWFEYGPTSSYGWTTPLAAAGEGGEDVTVGPEPLGELAPGTVYHFRLLATNAAGTGAGADETFTTAPPTPPDVVTEGASDVAPNSATVSGQLDARGLQATYGFQLAADGEAYGPTAGLTGLGAGGAQTVVSLHLTGLAPGTAYRYRLVATSVDGTSYGADASFTTGAFPNVFATPPAPLPAVAVPTIAFPAEVKSQPRKKTSAKRKARKRKASSRRRARRRPKG